MEKEKIKNKTKQKILRALEPKKKFLVSYGQTIWYEKEIEAVDRNDAERMFYGNEIEFLDADAYDSEVVDDSFEIVRC